MKVSKIVLLLILVILSSCKEVDDNSMNDGYTEGYSDGDDSETKVEEVRTVIKNVYINEDNFDEYDPFNGSIEETKSSYWYVYYNYNNEELGYKIVEIDVPYFHLPKIHKAIKGDKNGKFLGIEFFKRVSFEAYKANK